MRRVATVDIVPGDRIPRYVAGFGAALTLFSLGEIAVLVATGSSYLTNAAFLIGVITVAPCLAGIVYGGYWLDSAQLSPPRYSRVVRWMLSGLTVFLLINVALIVVIPTDPFAMVVGWIRWAVALGAGIGLLIGCIEGRAIERSLVAERAALRATYLEDQRDYLDYLNTILRHEVLNTATIINGYATLLRDEASLNEQSHQWAEIVIEESDEMSSVIDDVRVLLQTTDGAYRLEPVDLSRVLRDELRKVEHKLGSVDVEASIPDGITVRADDMLARVFGNLLANAVEHNDAATPRVSVTVDSGPDVVRVEISDNGPGIPEAELESLFDRVESRGSTHGLGLYLTRRLVTRYDGAVELVETGPDGSAFAVELPAATEAEDGDEDRKRDRNGNGDEDGATGATVERSSDSLFGME